MKWTRFLLLATLQVPLSVAIPGLSQEQEEWLESVTHSNVSTSWPLLSSNQSINLLKNIRNFQNITEIANYPYYQAVELWYSDKNRTKILRYDDVGDGAAWTGLHLASMVHEYAVTQDPSVMDRIWGTLEALDMMTACTGKLGYLPRFVGLASDPAYAAYYPNYTGGTFRCIAPYEDYIWLGHTSRDMYDGVSFGLANSWVWLPSNATIRRKVKMLVERITDSLRKDYMWIISPKDQFTNPLPLFSATWRKLALTVNYEKYKDMEAAYILDFYAAYEFEMKISSIHDSTYFPNELDVEEVYVLAVLEDDESRKNDLLKRFTEIAVNNAFHFQPGFAAFYLSAFPNTSTYMVPQGVLQGGLYDYPAAPDWDRYVDQSQNPKYMPHYDSDHSEYALMIRDRPPTTYFWQRNPTTLKVYCRSAIYQNTSACTCIAMLPAQSDM
ncbi:hypothetical protein GBAR_LOCUS17312 [Geodia barretti]|uniref:Uncharacterized protein n=2 Tax=Geodia barretti TaxID=519541 RepID=A0AA35WVN4_GEOBA|nr:hypothetical protein GBAR_LOCUS17312 [Geodia barretti]